MKNPLRDVHEGMKVVDADGRQIGTVEWVQFSDEDPSTPEAEVITDGAPRRQEDSLVDVLAKAFRADGLPEELQQRMRRNGFLRMDAAGLFAADRYILPDQIRAVSRDAIVLNVDRDSLIRG